MTNVLLHVGYIKAASSFLQKWFSDHPQLLYRERTLCGFRTVIELMNVAIEKDPAYRYHVISEERLSGGLPLIDYFRLILRHKRHHKRLPPLRENNAKICRLLYDLFPQARILIITRGFEGALRSVYSQYVRLGDCLTFQSFLELYQPYIEQWLDYDHLIDLYVNTFGSSNVVVLPFEMLVEGESHFLGALEQELGLEHRELKLGKVFPSLTASELYWYPKISQYTLRRIARRLSERMAIKLYAIYARFVMVENRLKQPIRLINWFFDRKESMDFPSGYLEIFRGKANLLRDYPRYAPYAAEYLFDKIVEVNSEPCVITK